MWIIAHCAYFWRHKPETSHGRGANSTSRISSLESCGIQSVGWLVVEPYSEKMMDFKSVGMMKFRKIIHSCSSHHQPDNIFIFPYNPIYIYYTYIIYTYSDGPPAPQHRSFPVESSTAARNLRGVSAETRHFGISRDPRTFLQNLDGSVWVQMLYIYPRSGYWLQKTTESIVSLRNSNFDPPHLSFRLLTPLVVRLLTRNVKSSTHNPPFAG